MRWTVITGVLCVVIIGCGDDDAATSSVAGDVAADTAGSTFDSSPLLDVGGQGPDVNLAPQAIAGVCQTDDNCLSGYCNTFPSGGYCSQRCGEGSPACPEGTSCLTTEDSDGTKRKLCLKDCVSSTVCRPGQVCPAQVKVCIPACQIGECNEGFRCNLASGICEVAPPCQPVPEVCGDGEDNDCDSFIDNGCGPTPVGSPYTRVIDMGRVRLGGGGVSRTLRFFPQQGASTFTIIALAEQHEESFMGLYSLVGPDGTDLTGFGGPGAPNQTSPSFGVYTALVPNSDQFELSNGLYQFSFFRYAGDEGQAPVSDVWVYVIENHRSGPLASTLDVNFWFVGLPGLTANQAETDSRFQSLVAAFSQVMTNQGIALGAIRYLQVNEPEATRFTIVDTGTGEGIDEHAELLQLTADLPADNHGLNFFFVQGFTGWGLLGKAGGIPGPPTINGTFSSGVVVSLADYFEHTNEPLIISLTAETMAHELGHQLGLYHTTEQGGTSHDHLLDTPECPAAQFDANGDGLVDPLECAVNGGSNLMFWTSSLSTQLSVGQRTVLHRNPTLRD